MTIKIFIILHIMSIEDESITLEGIWVLIWYTPIVLLILVFDNEELAKIFYCYIEL